MEAPVVKLEFTIDDTNTILKALEGLVFREAAPIITNIVKQVEEQNKEITEEIES